MQRIIVQELTKSINAIALYIEEGTPDVIPPAMKDIARISRILTRVIEDDRASAQVEWKLLSYETRDMMEEMAPTFVEWVR